MAVDSTDVLLKAEMLLERMRDRPEVRAARAKRRRRRLRLIYNRVLRILAGLFAVAFGSLLFSQLVMPLGFWGLLIVPLLMLIVTMVLVRFPRDRTTDEAGFSAAASLPALAPQVEDWLDSRRLALPAPARSEVDRILVELNTLEPQLSRVPAGAPEAADARRLMADHLPRLMDSYEKVPAAVRRRDPEADRQLVQGLKVVGEELERLNRRLGEESLDALEVEGRFLENRYPGQKRIEG